jgi:hypothetical protein
MGKLNLIKSGSDDIKIIIFLASSFYDVERTTSKRKRKLFITFVMRDFDAKNHFAVGSRGAAR